MRRAPRRSLVALLAVCSLCALSACGGSESSSSSELQARRTDLAKVASRLLLAREALAHEVRAARVAWPLIDRGIPHAPAPASHQRHPTTRAGRARARREAEERARRAAALASRLAATARAVQAASAAGVSLPTRLVARPDELTGAASSIAGVYELASGLIANGWPQVAAALAAHHHGSASAQAFLRMNVNTYIVSVYDGNFDLSLIGKMLQKAYARLGGKHGFRGALTPQQVAELSAAYSPAAQQLRPHPWEGLVAR